MPTTRIHPLLPSRAEVMLNPNLMYSDHVPQLLHVPLPNNDFVRVITFNVYGYPAPCGYFDSNTAECNWNVLYEKDEEYKTLLAQLGTPEPPDKAEYAKWRASQKKLNQDLATRINVIMDEFNNGRYQRIAAGLKRSVDVDEKAVDVILLQEVSKLQREALIDALGDEWEVLPCSSHHLVSCYRKTKYTHDSLLQTGYEESHANIINNKTNDYMQVFKLRKPNQSPIQIVNLHGDGDPEARKNKPIGPVIYELLTQNPGGISIVAGDFNIQMAPIEGQYGVTGISPARFNDTKFQNVPGATKQYEQYEIGSSTDGGLYKLDKKPSVKIKPIALNLETGKGLEESEFDKTRPLDYIPISPNIYRSEEEEEYLDEKLPWGQEYFAIAKSHSNFKEFIDGLCALYEAGLMRRGVLGFFLDTRATDNVKILENSPNPHALSRVLIDFYESGLLRTGFLGFFSGVQGMQNREMLAKSKVTGLLSQSLTYLKKSGFYNLSQIQSNLNKLSKCETNYSNDVGAFIQILGEKSWLTQERLDAILLHRNILFDANNVNLMKIVNNLKEFTDIHFDKIFTLCKENKNNEAIAIQAIKNYMQDNSLLSVSNIEQSSYEQMRNKLGQFSIPDNQNNTNIHSHQQSPSNLTRSPKYSPTSLNKDVKDVDDNQPNRP
jgi:hypothetical protein